MEIWFDGSSDGYRAAWAAVVLQPGRKPRLIYGIGAGIPCHEVDRWAARRVLSRLRDGLAAPVMLVSDRTDNVTNPVVDSPTLAWAWRSRRHPLIRKLDRMANRLRRAQPLPAAA